MFRFAAAARADLRAILDHVARGNPPAAARLLARFERQAGLLAGNPGIGRPRGDLRPGLRSSAVGSYLLFYRATRDGIEIVRILHGRRDIDAAFREDET